jgi:hypothetical protein
LKALSVRVGIQVNAIVPKAAGVREFALLAHRTVV